MGVSLTPVKLPSLHVPHSEFQVKQIIVQVYLLNEKTHLILVELMRINFDMYMLLRFPFLTRLYFVVCSQAKILCSNMCKCVGCKNFEESPDRKTLMHLADAAEVRVQQQTAAKTKLSSQMQDIPMRTLPPSTGEK